jgi:hypothetical protein
MSIYIHPGIVRLVILAVIVIPVGIFIERKTKCPFVWLCVFGFVMKLAFDIGEAVI